MKIREFKSILIVLLMISTLTYIGISLNLLSSHQNIVSRNKINKMDLKTSTTYTNSITIDALLTTSTTTSGNWTWAFNQGICTGSGTPGDPYIIQDDIFNMVGGICLWIFNSRIHFKIINCKFRSSVLGIGIFIENTTNGILEGNDLYNLIIGMDIVNCSSLTLFENNATSCDAGYLIDGGKFLTISRNLASKGGLGISFNDVNWSTIDKNEIFNNTGDGIFSFISNSNEFSENVLLNNSHGIHLVSCDKNILSKNTAKENPNHGFWLENCDENTVSKNLAYENANSGISIDSIDIDSNIISENIVYSNGFDGITLSFSDNNTIEGNNAYDNGRDGIRVSTGSNHNFLRNNLLNHNMESGIYIFSNSDNNILYKNSIKDNINHGIFIDTSDNNAVSENYINNNQLYGIYLLNSDDNFVDSNTANNNEIGLIIDTSNNNMIIGNTLLHNTYCINETGSTGNIFADNNCNVVSTPGLDFSLFLLIASIIEGVAIIGLVALLIIRRKRKS
ncbi:MAG: right-handed parallel beta-helix repeat-containing protein [Promethearchaeota archaeon]